MAENFDWLKAQQKYKWIVLWEKQMASTNGWLESQLRKAVEEDAPETAIRANIDGGWATLDDIVNLDMRTTLAKQAGLSGGEALPFTQRFYVNLALHYEQEIVRYERAVKHAVDQRARVIDLMEEETAVEYVAEVVAWKTANNIE